jgi:hypothetical protein
VAIVEAGAGGNVTTVRNESEQILSAVIEAGAIARLVRINPELPLADQPHHQSFTLSIASGGLEAVKAIADQLGTLRKRPRDEIFALDEARVPPLRTLPRRGWSESEAKGPYGGQRETADRVGAGWSEVIARVEGVDGWLDGAEC